ncbi:MAG: hypothetical protein AAGJ46_07450 [Planctomycetota bacterium]
MRSIAAVIAVLTVYAASPVSPTTPADPPRCYELRSPDGQRFVGRVLPERNGQRWLEAEGVVTRVRRPVPAGAELRAVSPPVRPTGQPNRTTTQPTDAELAWWLLFGGMLDD